MEQAFSRMELLLGRDALLQLCNARIAIFGLGGVGGYVAEGLARSGVGGFDLFDNDTIAPSNLNRQIIATTKTIGRAKVDVMKERILDINPQAQVTPYQTFYLPENAHEYDFTAYDYVVDAIDTVTAKIELVLRAKAAGVPIISSMGTGNKLDPTRFEVTDLAETSVCPLARVMRRELKARGVTHLKVVYSKEPPIRPAAPLEGSKPVPGSVAFVPPVAGLTIAAQVVKDLLERKR